ncbi:hypothetical protein [Sphingobacterium sp. UBA6320]|uniref:hypothetical protein n=1 Tax=Sphingobacterium sp. UBA6320 TaxID=1947510 RepID=UPI0025E45076|nr:hypothetical protein [Sphingobacterium sp. UBA6320]
MKLKLFIGFFVEELQITEEIQTILHYNFNIDLCTDDIFNIGNTIIDSLGVTN